MSKSTEKYWGRGVGQDNNSLPYLPYGIFNFYLYKGRFVNINDLLKEYIEGYDSASQRLVFHFEVLNYFP